MFHRSSVPLSKIRVPSLFNNVNTNNSKVDEDGIDYDMEQRIQLCLVVMNRISNTFGLIVLKDSWQHPKDLSTSMLQNIQPNYWNMELTIGIAFHIPTTTIQGRKKDEPNMIVELAKHQETDGTTTTHVRIHLQSSYSQNNKDQNLSSSSSSSSSSPPVSIIFDGCYQNNKLSI